MYLVEGSGVSGGQRAGDAAHDAAAGGAGRRGGAAVVQLGGQQVLQPQRRHQRQRVPRDGRPALLREPLADYRAAESK